jgi:CBS domain-containing protein
LEVLALLKDKARRVHTIASSQTVEDAICLMANSKVSTLLVTENDQPAGIFSEGDVFKSLLKNKSATFTEIKLEDAMTRNLLLAEPKDSIMAVLDKMVEADITHLPVIEEKKIIGMLTLKDLMQHQIDSLTDEIHQLKDYIADLHEAGQD